MRCNSLTQLLRPYNVESFLQNTWGQAVHHYPQSIREEAKDIMTLRSFELLISTLNRAHEGWLHFARGGLRQIPTAMVDQEGMLEMAKIRAAFASGETLYLTKAERLSTPLMEFCRAIELQFLGMGVGLRQPVNAHVFLTPGNSQGFAPHRDEHASFILQLEGSKEWNIYEPGSKTEVALQLPSKGMMDPVLLESMKKHTHQMQAGDVLFVPEWWPHEARSKDSHSLHVTLRIFPLRWADLMRQLCTEHPLLNEVIPRGIATHADRILDPLIDMLGSTTFVQALPKLLEAELGLRSIPTRPLTGDGLNQVIMAENLKLDTPLVRPWGTACAVFDSHNGICIAFPGGVIRGPAIMREVFEFIAETECMCPGDLPVITGGSSYDRLQVTRTMIHEGLLQVKESS